MVKQKVEIHPDEFKKKNCLSCKYGERATGVPCYEGNRETWEKCDEDFSEYVKHT